jgi:hypothetical protein
MLSRNGEATLAVSGSPLLTGGVDSTILQHLGKRRHFSIKLPQFDVVAVRELLGKYDGLIIISAVQVDCILNMIVASNQVGTILGHAMHHRLRGEHSILSHRETTELESSAMSGRRLYWWPLLLKPAFTFVRYPP